MTVHMSNGDQQNVDPEDNSTIPSTDDMNATHLESVQDEPVIMESNQNCSQNCVHNSEQENSSQLKNDLNNSVNDTLLNDENDVSNDAIFDTDKFRALLTEVEDTNIKPRWALSIIPCKEFEILLDMSLEVLKSKQYESNQLCQHFVTETIMQFFIKFYSDEIIDSIKPEVIVSYI